MTGKLLRLYLMASQSPSDCVSVLCGGCPAQLHTSSLLGRYSGIPGYQISGLNTVSQALTVTGRHPTRTEMILAAVDLAVRPEI